MRRRAASKFFKCEIAPDYDDITDYYIVCFAYLLVEWLV